MKRNLFLLVYAFICISLNAEITRSVYGMKLGITPEQAKNIINAKGLTYYIEDSKVGMTINVNHPFFAGVQWDGLVLTIFEGKVYSITFGKDACNYNEIATDVYTIVSKLDKYQAYGVEDQSYHTETNSGTIFNYLWNDGKTALLITGEAAYYGKSSLSVTYLDVALYNKFLSAKSRDEL